MDGKKLSLASIILVLCLLSVSILLVPIVAWVTHALFPLSGSAKTHNATSWPVTVPPEWPATPMTETSSRQMWRNVRIVTGMNERGSPFFFHVDIIEVGVPFRAFRSIGRTMVSPGTGIAVPIIDDTSYELDRGWRISKEFNPVKGIRSVLPTRIIPVGFFSNVIVYAFVLLVLFVWIRNKLIRRAE